MTKTTLFNDKCQNYTFKIVALLCKISGHLHNHVGLTENIDQSENEEFLVNDSP